jgi:sigma-E factor negative regulatory protein RseA
MNGEESRYERLSAFIDGELGSGDAAVVDHVLDDPELAAAWGRYQAIGDVLRREATGFNPELVKGVRERLAEEPTILSPKALRRRGGGAFHRWSTGAAVAAGVAAIAVVSVMRLEPAGDDIASTSAQAPTVAPVQQIRDVRQVARKDSDSSGTRPEMAKSLNRYLASHSNYAAGGSLNGVMPLATYISYDE